MMICIMGDKVSRTIYSMESKVSMVMYFIWDRVSMILTDNDNNRTVTIAVSPQTCLSVVNVPSSLAV